MPNLFPVNPTGLPPFHPDVAAWRRPYNVGPLSPEEVDHFYEYGFVIKHDLLPPTLLDPVIASVDAQVDGLAQKLLQAGRISSTCSEQDFWHRLTALEKEFPSVCTLLHRQGKLAPEVQRLWTSPELMGAARQLVGPDLAGHPVWNLRTKIPSAQSAPIEAQADQTTVPMHQDAAYLDSTADRVLQLTAWTPLLDATTHNGCMQVLKGGHRAGVVSPHVGCAGASWYVEMDMTAIPANLHVDPVEDLVTCEVPFGSVLFLNNLIPHRSLPNLSDSIRWSYDLRWQSPFAPDGYHGLKPPIVLAKASDPTYAPDWSHWAEVDRTTLQAAAQSPAAEARADVHGGEDDEFETRIAGPWMERWPLVNQNRHTHFWHQLQKGTTSEERRGLLWKS